MQFKKDTWNNLSPKIDTILIQINKLNQNYNEQLKSIFQDNQ